MRSIIDPATGFEIGIPEKKPFPDQYVPNEHALTKALEPLILSASGWRKIFAASGDEESRAPDISQEDRLIAGVMAYAWAGFLKGKTPEGRPAIAVGIDSRYTGPAIADCMIRLFLSKGFDVRYLFIVPAPEIMAYVKLREDIHGFAYISASHNPIGHNGVKFGLENGAVLGGSDSADLIRLFRQIVKDSSTLGEIVRAVQSCNTDTVKEVYEAVPRMKKESETAYANFTKEVVTGYAEPEKQKQILDTLSTSLSARPLGIVAELNGSARTLSIDAHILGTMGVDILAVNSKPREIRHRIVPEGSSLEQCKEELEKAHAADGRFLFGYVPDNDGDRGNIVYMDERNGKACILEAQTVFALSCISEIAYLVYTGTLTYTPEGTLYQKAAIAVNDATSIRIEAIAKAFDVKVYRAEVGEANVVNLAKSLRTRGYIVRILGEGSNGGTITHPSTVRDPLNTVFALLKLLLLRSVPGKPGLFEIWCERCGKKGLYKEDFSLTDILDSLPQYITTSVFEPEALMDIGTQNHGLLKERYESLFLKEWDKRKVELRERYGICTWKEINYEGIEEKHGMGRAYRTGKERGGLKILFKDAAGNHKAFLWMRGSGTEPVFRVMADIEGNNAEDEQYFLSWHKSMIAEADRTCT